MDAVGFLACICSRRRFVGRVVVVRAENAVDGLQAAVAQFELDETVCGQQSMQVIDRIAPESRTKARIVRQIERGEGRGQVDRWWYRDQISPFT